MKRKHTEGPYEVFHLVGGEHEIRAPRAANCVVADISCGHQYIGTKEDNHNITEAEATANADLFAASPTMYDYVTKKASEGDTEAQKIISQINA